MFPETLMYVSCKSLEKFLTKVCFYNKKPNVFRFIIIKINVLNNFCNLVSIRFSGTMDDALKFVCVSCHV